MTRPQPDKPKLHGDLPMARVGEVAALEGWLAELAVEQGLVIGPGDDAAAFDVPAGETVVLSTDTLVENTHFRASWSSPRDLGYRLVSAAASDLAAMAARPRAVVVALAVPPELAYEEFLELGRGVVESARDCRLAVAGGDTTASGQLVLTATVVGCAPPDRLTRRDTARVGDRVYVTGTLGDAASGLVLLDLLGELPMASRARHLASESAITTFWRRWNNQQPLATGCSEDELLALVRSFLRPLPRLSEAQELGRLGVETMIDVSDGLASELRHLARASDVTISVDAERVPVSAGARGVAAARGHAPWHLGFVGGEDYELLFTASPEVAAAVESSGLGCTYLGRVVGAGQGVELVVGGQTSSLTTHGYDHFTGRSPESASG